MRKTILLVAAAMCCATTVTAMTPQAENFKTGTRAFYLWRCGTAVEGDHDGNHYSQQPCHLDDGYTDYISHPGHRDGTGGWHDAGDYGKYTVNAGVTMANLFLAWDHFGDAIAEISLDIPDTAPGYPDFLKELKWETDFLLKMQYPDGSGRVSHKLTRKNFAPFIMPQDDHEKRYFTPWSSAATADFAATMAMASRYFRPYDPEYAQRCLDAALLSYEFLTNNTHDENFVQGDFNTGGYQTADPDDRLWAAAEIWETTGDADALADLERRIRDRVEMVQKGSTGNSLEIAGKANAGKLIDSHWDWEEVSNLGLWTYALSQREGRDPQLLALVNDAIQQDADTLAQRIRNDQYGCPLDHFFWGCNGLAARSAVNLQVAHLLGGPDYKAEQKAINDWILGNNQYGRSFVTGMGPNPPMRPHDRRSAADGIDAPWPGYLVGGGHTPTDWVDDQDDYARNEIAINWQAGLVYLLASQLGK